MWTFDIQSMVEKQGITSAYQLATKLNVSTMTAWRLMQPRKVISEEQINLLCTAFPNCKPWDFIVEVPEPKGNGKKGKK